MNNEWTPDISKNVFWNEVGENLIKQEVVVNPDFRGGNYSNTVRPIINLEYQVNDDNLNLSWVNPTSPININENVKFDANNCVAFTNRNLENLHSEITFSNNELEITGTKCSGWYEAGVKITPKYSYLDKITFKIKSDSRDIRLTVEQHDYDWFYINLNNYLTDDNKNEWVTVTISKDNFKNLTWHNNTNDSSDFKFDGTDVTAIYLVYTNGSDGVTRGIMPTNYLF